MQVRVLYPAPTPQKDVEETASNRPVSVVIRDLATCKGRPDDVFRANQSAFAALISTRLVHDAHTHVLTIFKCPASRFLYRRRISLPTDTVRYTLPPFVFFQRQYTGDAQATEIADDQQNANIQQQLTELKAQGMLTDEEFAAATAKVFGS